MAPQPVFCKTIDLCRRREEVDSFELCDSAAEAIGGANIIGAQEFGRLWKIYTVNIESRTSLLSKGINFRGRHVTLHDSNPYINPPEYLPSEKVIIKDIPLDVDNSEIKLYLESKQVAMTSDIKYCTIMRPDRTWSDYRNGDRYVYVRTPLLPVLPRIAVIAGYKCRIIHRSQKDICKSCRQLGHKCGDEVCPALLSRDRENYSFRGYRMTLSNMWPCNISYDGKHFKTLEHAYQWKKAKSLGYDNVANAIHHARHGGAAKGIADEWIPYMEAEEWSRSTDAKQVMEDLLSIKARNNTFFYELHSTGKSVIVEATTDLYWASGIPDPNVAAVTNSQFWQGENMLGTLLMKLRDATREEYEEAMRNCVNDEEDFSAFEDPYHDDSLVKPTSTKQNLVNIKDPVQFPPMTIKEDSSPRPQRIDDKHSSGSKSLDNVPPVKNIASETQKEGCKRKPSTSPEGGKLTKPKQLKTIPDTDTDLKSVGSNSDSDNPGDDSESLR